VNLTRTKIAPYGQNRLEIPLPFLKGIAMDLQQLFVEHAGLIAGRLETLTANLRSLSADESLDQLDLRASIDAQAIITLGSQFEQFIHTMMNLRALRSR